ncbi:MAG TPA: LytTR family DNA-binding domain-containing protein [Caulobacter sp.]|nr:LytTR family DNA-binding domain-containing protein [Caulobacter sp.]
MAGTTGKLRGTSGGFFGMTGEERLWLTRAWLLGACLIAAIAVVNGLTLQHDAPKLGVVAPAIWEGSSALVTLFIFAIPATMAFWMSRKQPRWWVAVPAHLIAVFLYSVLHVSGFVALRKIGHAVLLHETYRFGPLSTEFPYEFRKDMMSYGLATIIYWLALRRSAQRPPEAHLPAPPAMFDILDGARMVRVPMSDILAVRSAGNYVEFVLADQRRPLMRSSLGAVLDSLAAHGFVRSHKSWVINKARVTGLKPEGSGDYAVELGDLEVPLSRRFPETLAALRN